MLPVTASHLTDVGQMCTHRPPHGAPTHTTVGSNTCSEFPSQGNKTKGWEGPECCLDVESAQMKHEHLKDLNIQDIFC